MCGPDPDQALVDFTADLDWLTRQGVSVRRANLAQDPAAFAESASRWRSCRRSAHPGCRAIVVDDVTVLTGRYPSRAELARIAGVEAPDSATDCCGDTAPASVSSGCCADTAPASVSSGCCGAPQPVTIRSGSVGPSGRSTMIELLQDPPRFLFLTGKGGVGKTSIACASAVELAHTGKRVLLVSTDPASNVGQVFGQRIGNAITPIAGVEGLDALEIDPEAAAEEYRQRALAPIRSFLSAKDVADVTEQLSGSCTTEIASFNEFTGFLAGNDTARGYDHIVFDTAPTGHTVRLLQLPGEWTPSSRMASVTSSCLGRWRASKRPRPPMPVRSRPWPTRV